MYLISISNFVYDNKHIDLVYGLDSENLSGSRGCDRMVVRGFITTDAISAYHQ